MGAIPCGSRRSLTLLLLWVNLYDEKNNPEGTGSENNLEKKNLTAHKAFVGDQFFLFKSLLFNNNLKNMN